MVRSRSYNEEYLGLEAAALRAAINPTAWSDVIAALGRMFPGTRLQFWGTDSLRPTDDAQINLGYDQHFGDAYLHHFQHINPWWAGWARTPVGKTIRTSDACSDAEMRRSEFYNDWVRPQEDIIGGGGQVLLRDPTRSFYLAGNIPQRFRDRTETPFVETVARLAPLLRHALEVNRTILGLQIRILVAGSGGENQETALLLVDHKHRVLHANATGVAWMLAGKLLRYAPTGTLAFPDADAQAAFQASLAAKARRVLRYTARTDGQTYSVQQIPVQPEDLTRLAASPLVFPIGPMALLLIERQSSGSGRTTGLARRLGLTRTEAEIALMLAEGLSLAEIAEARQTSIHTVRNQVKAALAKTGVRRQSDLVMLLDRARRGL